MRLSTKRSMLLLLFTLFLSLRMFTNSANIRLASDSLKFLELAKNFPYHTLYNHQLYTQHPPFYPYMIHFFTWLLYQDYLAAIVLSFLSSCITFFVIYKFFKLISRRFDAAVIAMVIFSLSAEMVLASKKVVREPFVIMLIVSAIYFYVKWLKFNGKKSLIAASVFGALLGATSDHTIFVLPAFALSYLFFNRDKANIRKFHFPNIKYAIVPIAIILLVYLSWLSAKAYIYSSSEYYPTGLEGTPVKTGNLGPLQLITPTYFYDYEQNAGIRHGVISRLKNYAFNFGYMINLEPFSIPRGLNLTTKDYLLLPKHILYMIFIYAPLAAITLYGFISIVYNSVKRRKLYNNADLYVLLLFFIFAFPITQRVTSPSYIFPAYIFLFYIIGVGLAELAARYSAVPAVIKRNKKLFAIIFVLLLLALAAFWISNNPYVVLFSEKVVASQKTGDYISRNIGKNSVIMAQPGYVVKLIYTTENKILGLPSRRDELTRMIKYYKSDYVVFGRYFTLDEFHYSKDSIDFIQNNPGKFKLVAAIDEDNSRFFPPEDKKSKDVLYIYKILKD